MRYGIIYPRSTVTGWSPEAEALVGKIVVANRIIFNSLGDADHVIIGPEKDKDDFDQIYGSDVDIYLNGVAVPAECVIAIKDCDCSTTQLARCGCTCGSFRNEKEFKIKLRKSAENLRRR